MLSWSEITQGAVVAEVHPVGHGHKLGEVDAKHIRAQLQLQIDEMEDGQVMPFFRRHATTPNGSIKYACDTQATFEWLQQAIPKIQPLPRWTFEVICEKEGVYRPFLSYTCRIRQEELASDLPLFCRLLQKMNYQFGLGKNLGRIEPGEVIRPMSKDNGMLARLWVEETLYPGLAAVEFAPRLPVGRVTLLGAGAPLEEKIRPHPGRPPR